MLARDNPSGAATALWVCPAMHRDLGAVGSLGRSLDAAHEADDALGRNLRASVVVGDVRMIHAAIVTKRVTLVKGDVSARCEDSDGQIWQTPVTQRRDEAPVA